MDLEMQDLLNRMAVVLERKMTEIGGNPRDPQEVEAFVNGCGIAKKLKRLITEELDEE